MFKKQQETLGRQSAVGKVSMGLKLFEVRNQKTAEAKKAATPKPAKVEMVETKSKKMTFKGVAPNAFVKKGNHWTMMRSGKVDHTIIRPTQKKSALEEVSVAIGGKAQTKASPSPSPLGGKAAAESGPMPSVLGAVKPAPLAATVAATTAAAEAKRKSLVQTLRKSLKAMSVRSEGEEEEEKRSDDAVKPFEMSRAAGSATIKSVKPEQATMKSVKADQATIKSSGKADEGTKSSAGKPEEEQKEDKDDQSEDDVSSLKGADDANDSDVDKDEDEADKDRKKKKSDDDSDREDW
jgi:hypothetical protein